MIDCFMTLGSKFSINKYFVLQSERDQDSHKSGVTLYKECNFGRYI